MSGVPQPLSQGTPAHCHIRSLLRVLVGLPLHACMRQRQGNPRSRTYLIMYLPTYLRQFLWGYDAPALVAADCLPTQRPRGSGLVPVVASHILARFMAIDIQRPTLSIN